MKILLALSDPLPLLAPSARKPTDALPTLPVEWQKAGHEVSVAAPLTPAVEALAGLKTRPTGVKISLPLGHDRVSIDVRETRVQGIQTFLFRHEESFGKLERPLAETVEPRPAALFSKLVIELARRLNPVPDIVLVYDWPGMLAPVFLRAQNLPFASAILLRDPAEQGSFPIEDFGLLNLGWEWFRPETTEFFGRVNFLKAGVLHTDAVIVDGDLERDALMTPEGGAGLDGVFRENWGRFQGILTGLASNEWDPGSDSFLPRKFRPASLVGKTMARSAALAGLRLAAAGAGPTFLLDLALPQAPELIKLLAQRLDEWLVDDVRVIVLGEIDEAGFHIASRKHADKLALAPTPDERIRHLALGGADFQLFLGLGSGVSAAARRSLRYGAWPIAPAAAGWRQIVEDHQPGAEEKGHALFFYHQTSEAIFDAVAHRAAGLARPAAHWAKLQGRGMVHAAALSWARAAAAYAESFERLRR